MNLNGIIAALAASYIFVTPQSASAEDHPPASERPVSAKELASLKVTAAGGSPSAQFALGLAYENGGSDFASDTAQALDIFERLASNGFVPAREELGFLLLNGKIPPENVASVVFQARMWADSGEGALNFVLGEVYRRGISITSDASMSCNYFQKSAEAGYTLGQFYLAVCFERGEGEPSDYSKARHWYRLAADRHLPQAEYNLGLMYLTGEGGDRDFDQARVLFETSAENGIADAAYRLGGLYYLGEGVPKDLSKVRYWWTKAAQGGVIEAQLNVAALYANGEGGPRDMRSARKWFQKAADQGNAKAAMALRQLSTMGF
jgi:TPR repeat protein